MMELLKAHELAMSVVEDIRAQGIEVKVVPSSSRTRDSTLKKYGDRPDCVKPEKWFHVTFFPWKDEHKALIQQKAKELGWRGIGFDTGGCAGQRDWELDWSFRVTDTPDGELEARRDEVEDLIKEEIEDKNDSAAEEG